MSHTAARLLAESAVELGLQLAQLDHPRRHEQATLGRVLAQDLERRCGSVRVGVVGVVDHHDAGAAVVDRLQAMRRCLHLARAPRRCARGSMPSTCPTAAAASRFETLWRPSKPALTGIERTVGAVELQVELGATVRQPDVPCDDLHFWICFLGMGWACHLVYERH